MKAIYSQRMKVLAKDPDISYQLSRWLLSGVKLSDHVELTSGNKTYKVTVVPVKS